MNQSAEVQAMIDKARESLASAESDLTAKRYNSCANRAYFACFQAVVAIFLRLGMAIADERIAHQTVVTKFSDQLVRRRKLYPATVTGELYVLMERRHQADYRTASVSRSKALDSVRRARSFVEIVLQ